MLRRLLLVGLLLVVVEPGSLTQLAVATGFSVGYLFVQMRVSGLDHNRNHPCASPS